MTKLRIRVAEYLGRAENTITALRDAGESMSDGLIIAMILGGLPDSFKPFAVHMTQNEDNITFTEFKRILRVCEDSEKKNKTNFTDNVMKTSVRQSQGVAKTHAKGRKDVDMICYKYGRKKMLPISVVQFLQK